MRFENKTAVIATSGGSIGLECARKLEEEGAKVIILDLDHAGKQKTFLLPIQDVLFP